LLHNLYHKTSQTVLIQPTLAVPGYVDRLVSVNVDKMLADGIVAFSVMGKIYTILSQKIVEH
jgi:hypothetical protein